MAKGFINQQRASLFSTLACLTIFFIAAQSILFFIHFSTTELIDSLTETSIFLQFLHPVVLRPLIAYLTLQMLAYLLLTVWVWFMANSLKNLLALRPTETHLLGIFLWCNACLALLVLNLHYFSASFFSQLLVEAGLLNKDSSWLIIGTVSILTIATVLALINFFLYGTHWKTGTLLLLVFISFSATSLHEAFFNNPTSHTLTSKPNVILIGIDSLRPDFTSYFGSETTHTPNIDKFLRTGITYTNAYTPLARTFPSWVSILTAKHPIHHGARNNLVNPEKALAQDNLARELHQAGYETIYATDEKRFSNITRAYGFDSVLGPGMGVNDFLLGALTDFPMNNLLASSAIGRFLFPFNYGNRAAAITYEPSQFMQQLKAGLANKSNKPLFLAVHLCLTHWPNTWASEPGTANDKLVDKYRRSIERMDSDIGRLFALLENAGLLQNSIVVMLSDHGTSLGLPHDRIIDKSTYLGDKRKLARISPMKLNNAPADDDRKKYFTINTAYGQGTNILSLKQYHVILSFKRYGDKLTLTGKQALTSLYDIAPTILNILSIKPMPDTDGASLTTSTSKRALFIETGDSFSEIETDHIYIDKVLKHEIGIYNIDPATGLLIMDAPAAQSHIKNKERAIINGDWLLARIPAKVHSKIKPSDHKTTRVSFETHTTPAYFVLVNLKTGAWTIDLDSPFAQRAPSQILLKQMKEFYRGEI